MTFNACLTTIAGIGQQSWIAFGFPAMVYVIRLIQFTVFSEDKR